MPKHGSLGMISPLLPQSRRISQEVWLRILVNQIARVSLNMVTILIVEQRPTLARLQSTSRAQITMVTRGIHRNTNPVQKTEIFVPPRDGRQTPRTLKCLEKLDNRQRDSKYCVRGEDTVFRNSISEVAPDFQCVGSGLCAHCRGSQPVVIKGSDLQSPNLNRRILQSSVCGPKERGFTSACDRPQCPQQVCIEPSFPDGKHSLFKNSIVTRRLYDKYRSKRRLPFCRNRPSVPKVPPIHVECHDLPIQSSTVRPMFGPEDIYKTNETSGSLSKKESYTPDSIPGRFSHLRAVDEGVLRQHSNISHPSSIPRIHSQLREILSHPISGDHISGIRSELGKNDALATSRENPEDNRVLLSPKTKTCSVASISEADGTIRVGPSCNLASTALLPSPPTRPYKGLTNQQSLLRQHHIPEREFQSRIGLVDCQHPQGQRQPNPPSFPIHNDINRCVEKGVGSSRRECEDQWEMVRTGIQDAHKFPRAESSISRSSVFSQRENTPHSFTSDRQHNCDSIYKQQRRDPLPTTVSLDSGAMGMVSGERHIHHRVTHSGLRKCHSGHRVQGIQRHERLEVGPFSYPATHNVMSDRSLCQSSVSPTRKVHQLETRPSGNSHRCINNRLEASEGVRFSPVQSDLQDPREGNERSDRDCSSNSGLAGSAVVADASQTMHFSPNSASQLSFAAAGPIRPVQGSPDVSSPTPSRVSCLNKRFEAEGFSPEVTKLLISATRTSTRRTYESSWKRWSCWCSKRKINPISAPINEILIFLTDCFNSGSAYRTLNVLRSAISSTHSKIDGYLIGQHPFVTQLLRGALLTRPPQPRYTQTWDVDAVLNYILSMEKNRLLKLKELSLKLVMLMALSCPERISSLSKLDLRYVNFRPEGATFTLATPRKTGSYDKTATALFATFQEDKKLCPVKCLKQYLKLTSDFRPASSPTLPNLLFLSFIRPHNPVTSASIGRWLRTIMKLAGIDTQIFKAHSVRSASTTAASNAFVPLSTIMSMADWSSPSTFKTFYYKPTLNTEYARGVLSSNTVNS